MAGTWVPYTNEKLYLARLQIDLSTSPELADKGPLKESARQAGVLFLHAAWVGLLNEIAESFQLKKVEIHSLSDLEKALGATTSEVSPLLALHEDPHSWLRLLQREHGTCTRPQPKTTVPHAEQSLIMSAVDEGEQRYHLMLQDLKDYIAAFRDRTNEW